MARQYEAEESCQWKMEIRTNFVEVKVCSNFVTLKSWERQNCLTKLYSTLNIHTLEGLNIRTEYEKWINK